MMPRWPKKGTKSRALLDEAMREVHGNTPARVKHTRRKFGKKRAERQRRAIAISKAREAGARLPRGKPKRRG